MNELGNNIRRWFGKSSAPQSRVDQISQQLYRRNTELLETNNVLTLLRMIDTLALETNESLQQLCQRLCDQIAKTNDYACVGILSKTRPADTEMVLYGLSTANFTSESPLGILGDPVCVPTNQAWLQTVEADQTVCVDTLTDQQVGSLLDCKPEAVTNFRKQVPIQSVHLIKLMARGQLVGMIVIGFLDVAPQMTATDTLLLGSLGKSVGVVIDNKLLLDENVRVLAQLQQEKDSIEETVQIRTKELRAAQEQLKAADKMKSEFIVLTSHNLRTPLTILHGNLELLGVSNMTEQQLQSVHGIQQATKRLRQLVEELLAISSIEAGDAPFKEEIDVKDLLEPLLEEAKNMASSKELVFDAKVGAADASIQANALLLREALRNIIDNAFKFTSKGNVTLSVHVDDGLLHVAVSDTGIGIDPKELPYLFTKFHRGTDTLTYDYEGGGIGLFFAKLVIEGHGGSIDVSSDFHKGSTFTINLPIVK